ncbi:cell division protein FtsA [Elusimicrobiota bacterium]
MAKKNILCALDIGSSKVMALLAVLSEDRNKIKVVSGSEVACRGLKGGVVVNIPETARAIAQAVELCEEKASIVSGKGGKGAGKSSDFPPVEELTLSVRGKHFESFNNKGAYNIARTDKEITTADVESVIEIAKAVPISQDREVLHVISQDFWVDRQKGVPNPVGMEGSLLEVDVHILTGISSHINNVVKAVNRAGFKASQICYGLLALGDAVVTEEEKEQGCLLLDFGGQTVGMGVYYEGALRYSKEIPFASDTITRDLAHCLRTSIVNAQRIKEEYGACLMNMTQPDEEIEFYGLDGRETKRVKRRIVIEVIQSRVEEIFSFVGRELENSALLDTIQAGGVIITGGGSMMRGLAEAGTELLAIPTRLGIPQMESVDISNEVLMNLGFASSASVLQYSTRPPLWSEKVDGKWRSGFDLSPSRKGRKRLSGKFRTWLEELFS